jgi:tRNA/tmRNA/rRNA uracil-C5-methylase (TrmA/RlmC/RlmD family)
LRAVIEKLAPTGEGVVRTREGVGLVSGALPGEDVEAEVLRISRKIWRGRVAEIHAASPARRSGGHAGGCPACDWAHFDLSAARDAKRDLFLETMSRIGKLPAGDFGALSVEPSPNGYRLRSRFHAERRGSGEVVVGGFAPRTHRVEPLADCLALGAQARALLPRFERALAKSGEDAPEIATVESLDGKRRLLTATLSEATLSASSRGEASERGKRLSTAIAPLCDGCVIRDASGRVVSSWGEQRLWISPAGRELPATADAFFQANRFLVRPLAEYVRDAAAEVPASDALDLFGGVGLFAGSLLDAGHSVVSVESDRGAAAGARLARDRWHARERWGIERGNALGFAAADPGREAVIVADPPRGGLGLSLARALAGRAGRRIIYVSCDPATLARDLAAITAEGWTIAAARLFDLFPLTHRVEAVVVLDRSRRP